MESTLDANGHRPPRWFWIGLGLLVLVALGLRYGVVRQYEAQHPMANRPQVDEGSYDRWAQRIAGGDWLGEEVFFQEPGYAYGLATVYSLGETETRLGRTRNVQVALGALGVFLVGLLGWRLFGPASGLLAATALAFYRPALLAPCLLLKVNAALPVILGIALLLERGRRRGWPVGTALGLGALAGFGALLRGNLLVLIPVLALWPLVRRADWKARLRSSAFVVLGALAALSPALIRNQVVGGLWVVTSGAGTNFFGGNNSENPNGVATEFDWIRAIPEHEPGDWRREAERRVGRDLNPVEVSNFWLTAALDSMRTDPWLHAGIFANKARLVLSAYEVPDNHFLDWDARYVPLLRVPFGGFGFWGLLALAGMFGFLFRGRPLRGWDPLLLFVFYAGTIVLTVMSMRARLAIVPLMLPFLGWFVVAVHEAWRARSRRPMGAFGLALGLAALCVHIPFFNAEEEQLDFDERDFNLAIHLMREEADMDQVAQIAKDLESRYPRAPRVVVLRAEVEYRQGRGLLDASGGDPKRQQEAANRIEGAVRELEALDRSLANAHELFRADYLMGAIRQYQGRFSEAAAYLRAARRFDDDDRDVRRRLAVSIANASVGASEPDRSRGLAEALRLYEELLAEESDPELERLRSQVQAALAGN